MDFFANPWSLTALFPAASAGPLASVSAGPTFAYNPRTDTGCAGAAVAGVFPAGGHSFSTGPLTVGNLGNADKILDGWSVFGGAQSTLAMGVTAMGNTNGSLGGATFGTPGAAAGFSVSGCKPGVGKTVLNWVIDNLF